MVYSLRGWGIDILQIAVLEETFYSLQALGAVVYRGIKRLDLRVSVRFAHGKLFWALSRLEVIDARRGQ